MNGIVIDARFFANLKRILEILVMVLDLLDGEDQPPGFVNLHQTLKDEYKGSGPFRKEVEQYQSLAKLAEQIPAESGPSAIVQPHLHIPPGRGPEKQ